VSQQPTWIGLQIGDFLIDSQIAEGMFSWVYQGAHTVDGSEAAFKIAKPLDMVGLPRADKWTDTESIFIFSGGVTDVHPEPAELLLQQANKLQSCADNNLILVSDASTQAGVSYYQMEVLDGLTLRKFMKASPVPVQMFIELAQALARVQNNPNFGYHGDIKPDHVLFGARGPKLIDPGFFGLVNCQEGEALDCIVTTSAYYPLLKPDDLFAFGIMLWEVACRQHPLRLAAVQNQTVGNGLDNLVRSYENVAQYFLSPLMNIVRPCSLRPEMTNELETVLLRAMRLRIDESGNVDSGDGYRSFNELVAALEQLQEVGILSL
jgi:serine/threonine protein kinase